MNRYRRAAVAIGAYLLGLVTFADWPLGWQSAATAAALSLLLIGAVERHDREDEL